MLVNRNCFVKTLINISCLLYKLINSRFATKYQLKRISIKKPICIIGFETKLKSCITKVAVILIDINRHIEDKAYFYIAPKLALYNLILEML
jgi:hypothetical protein